MPSVILLILVSAGLAAAITYLAMRLRSAAAEARLATTLEQERRNAAEKLELLQQAREQLRQQFEAMAATALQQNNRSFLDLAQTKLADFQHQAKNDLSERQKAIETIVKPVTDCLKQMDEQVRHLEKERANAYGSLTAQVASLLETQKALQSETGNLVKALREPQARGRWGEIQLRRVVELAGMLDHCDFGEQVTATNEQRRFRPDLVVKLPGEKNIVIDSKAPLTANLAALEASDEATRAARLADHARQIRQHIDSLGEKAYWAQFQPTPEFVVLFLPGEVFFRAALDGDPELIDYGVAQKVIVASPTTLIALLKAVAYGWNQKNLAGGARKIGEAGKILYDRLCTMTSHFVDIGRKLGGAVESYNKAVGSMERSVFPIARKFADLDKSLDAGQLAEPPQLERSPRQLEAPDWSNEPKDAEQLPLVDRKP